MEAIAPTQEGIMPTAIIKAGLDLPLSHLNKEEINNLLENLEALVHPNPFVQLIEETTGADLTYIKRDNSVRINGLPKDVKYAYGLLVCQIDQMTTKSELRLNLLDEAFLGGVQFKETVFSAGTNEAFILQPTLPALIGFPKKTSSGSSGSILLQQAAKELLGELLRITQEDQITGFKFEIRLGKTYITKRDGAEIAMKNLSLSPGGFQMLVHSQTVDLNLDELCDLSSIDQDLQKLGFRRHGAVKYNLNILHNEVRGKDVVPVLWVAKVGDGIGNGNLPGTARYLELAKAYINERIIGMLTNHGTPDDLDSRLEIKAFVGESRERFEKARERVRNRLRYIDMDEHFAINSKEERQEMPLIYPDASATKSIIYKKKDVKLTIVEVTENVRAKHWELKIVTKDFAEILQSILTGKIVSVGRMTVELKRFFDIANEIKGLLGLKPSFQSKSECHSECLQSDGFDSFSGYIEDSGNSTTARESNILTTQTPNQLDSLRLSYDSSYVQQYADKKVEKNEIISPELITTEASPVSLGSALTPLTLGSPVLLPQPFPSKRYFHPVEKDRQLRDWKEERELRCASNNLIPNMPETRSVGLSTLTVPARRFLFGDLKKFGDSFGFNLPGENEPELREFLDEVLLNAIDEQAQRRDYVQGKEELIRRSPDKTGILQPVVHEEDLLLG